MIEIKIHDGERGVTACVDWLDLIVERPVIYLGGNTRKLNERLRRGEIIGFVPEIMYSENPSETLFEKRIEKIISHEIMHIAVYNVTKNVVVTKMLDNIDHPTKPLQPTQEASS